MQTQKIFSKLLLQFFRIRHQNTYYESMVGKSSDVQIQIQSCLQIQIQIQIQIRWLEKGQIKSKSDLSKSKCSI